MKVSLQLSNGTIEFECVNAVATTGAFPYWTFWLPIDGEGNQKVTFYRHDTVLSCTLDGPPEEDDSEKPNLTVLRGGEEDGPVPQN